MATWDASFKNSPAGADSPITLDDKIRETRAAIEERASNEHTTVTTGTAGSVTTDWLHKAGSAKAYYQASAPTLRPDGSTSLNSDDAGRLWVDSDDNLLYVWSGSAWEIASPTMQFNMGTIAAADTVVVHQAVEAISGSTVFSMPVTSYTTAAPYDATYGYMPYPYCRVYTFVSGTARFKFSIAAASGGTAYGQIYKNGSAVGTERSTTGTGYTEYTEDLACAVGDYFELKVKYATTSPVYFRGFKLCGTITAVAGATVTEVTNMHKALNRSEE